MSFDHEKEMQRRAANLSRQCRHFNGTCNSACDAGIAYASVRIEGAALRESHPCHDSLPSPHQRCASCVKPTLAEARSEVDAEEIEHKATFAAIRKVHERAAAIGLRKSHGGSDTMPCPKCGTGTLRYSVASMNGHMHGCCETTRCLSWME